MYFISITIYKGYKGRKTKAKTQNDPVICQFPVAQSSLLPQHRIPPLSLFTSRVPLSNPSEPHTFSFSLHAPPPLLQSPPQAICSNTPLSPHGNLSSISPSQFLSFYFPSLNPSSLSRFLLPFTPPQSPLIHRRLKSRRCRPHPQSDRASLPPLWTFTLATVYFGLASSLSIIGYLRYRHEVEPESNTDNADRGSYVPPILGEDTDTALEIGSLNCYCEPKFRTVASVWGYALQIIFQMSAGAVALTDFVFWLILYPSTYASYYGLSFYWSFLRNTRNDSALYVILLLDFSNSFACQSTIMKWNIFQHGEKLDREKVWLIMIL
ncbi:hypothetical protein ACS0TY_011749 [Phlomoides rotata]